jgi:hypothetical protein
MNRLFDRLKTYKMNGYRLVVLSDIEKTYNIDDYIPDNLSFLDDKQYRMIVVPSENEQDNLLMEQLSRYLESKLNLEKDTLRDITFTQTLISDAIMAHAEIYCMKMFGKHKYNYWRYRKVRCEMEDDISQMPTSFFDIRYIRKKNRKYVNGFYHLSRIHFSSKTGVIILDPLTDDKLSESTQSFLSTFHVKNVTVIVPEVSPLFGLPVMSEDVKLYQRYLYKIKVWWMIYLSVFFNHHNYE